MFAQLENLEKIQARRKEIWNTYYTALKELEHKGFIRLPFIPAYATNNAHMFYLLCKNETERSRLIAHLKAKNILAVFHYLQLNKSQFYSSFNDNRQFANTDKYADCLLRLPFFYELKNEEQQFVIAALKEFYYQ